MDLKELLDKINGLNFKDIVRRETREHFISMEYSYKNDTKLFRKGIINGQKMFFNNEDKVIYLVEALNYINEQISDLDYLISNHVPIVNKSNLNHFDYEEEREQERRKQLKLIYESQIFYVVRDLEKLGVVGLDVNAFLPNQTTELTRKINALLIKIDELSVGQEVIYDSIELLKGDLKELKDDFPLGKKRWYQRFSGIITNYLGKKGADALLEAIKPEIMKIIHDMPIMKFLS